MGGWRPSGPSKVDGEGLFFNINVPGRREPVQPFTLLIKPSGSDCNINCRYCFYKDRPAEFGRGKQRMSEEVLEKLVAEYMQLGFPAVGFAWQGGEPTLMGLEFFRKAVELQKKHASPGRQISNKIQTNGILLNDEWCRFLHENKFLLGVSIDGPEPFHNEYRLDHAGKGTFDRVMRGIETCQKHKVEFNALVLLHNKNTDHPEELFRFLIENDLSYVQFIPCVERERETDRIADFSITPQQYGDFLCRMFDLWYDYGPEKLNIRLFDSVTTYYVLGRHTMCTFNNRCEGFVVIEHTGEAFCCEFFVEPEWRLGNILETPLSELENHSRKRTFARNKRHVCNQCLVCKHLEICRGGCPKDRVRLGNDSKSENYFCSAYKRFFDHALPRFQKLAADIEAGITDRHTRSAEKIRLQIP
jgi:uncharacterized protein